MSSPPSTRGASRRRARVLVAFMVALLSLFPAGAMAHGDGLADEPVIPGVDWSTDFQIAPNGDVYVAHHDGQIDRYRRLASSSVAQPTYDLTPEHIYKFSVTKQNDRGLVGITLDSAFATGQRYLYALVTRGSADYVGDVPGGSKNGIRRTGFVARIAVPASGPAPASAVTTILGADAPADPDSSCKPFTLGQAAASGETDAAPNGVKLVQPEVDPGGALVPDFTEDHIFPDGNLATRADGAYDCIPSDGDTHGLGSIASAPDGTLYLTVGDATLWSPPQNASLRSYNLESYAGKVLHIDRSGRGVGSHPFCPTETDLRRVCTKIWALGLRNAFRFSLLPPDSESDGEPALAVADVGNFTMEHLAIAHPGDNLGWPCWEGSYYNFDFAGSTAPGALITGWGGPSMLPSAPGKKSCERATASGNGSGSPKPAPGIVGPIIEYQHEQDAPGDEKRTPNDAAIVGGPWLAPIAGTDPDVALPSDWNGSLIFGDYVRGWIQRISPDVADPGADSTDGGLLVPADAGRGPTVQTEVSGTREPDPILDQIADPPPVVGGLPAYYRLTSRQGPDGTLWYLRYSGESQAGGLYRLRTAPKALAAIGSVDGACATGSETQGPITLTATDAGAGATYAWDTDGDGLPDSGRTARSTTLSTAELAAAAGKVRWIRLLVTGADGDRSVATRYVCAGRTPQVSITAPADGTQVVEGAPITVTASRPAGDAAASGIPDSALRWRATTVHGSTHQHNLLDRDTPFETVGGQQRLQLTVTPDVTHELGSYTLVRIFAPQADGNSVSQTIRLYPKPVQVTLSSSPSGARLSMARDLAASIVDPAPGSFTAAAGHATSLSAGTIFTDADGQVWRFKRWSDSATGTTRNWQVPANGGVAPIAIYAAVPAPDPTTPAPTSPKATTPLPTTPKSTTPLPTTPKPTTPPPTSTPTVTTPAPGPGPDPALATPAAPTPALPATPPAVAVIPPPRVVTLLPPTVLELRQAPLALVSVASQGKRDAAIRGTLSLGRTVAAGGLTIKGAVRNADCRWWSFRKRGFVGPSKYATQATVRRAAARACLQPPSWSRVAAAWTGSSAIATVRLGKGLPSGRYAVRLRVSRGKTVLAERVRALRVR